MQTTNPHTQMRAKCSTIGIHWVDVRFLMKGNDWHRKSCHLLVRILFVEEKKLRAKSEIWHETRDTKKNFLKTLRQSCSPPPPTVVICKTFSVSVSVCGWLWLSFACDAILENLHCFRYYCHEPLRIEWFPLFCRASTIPHRLYFIYLRIVCSRAETANGSSSSSNNGIVLFAKTYYFIALWIWHYWIL